LIAVNVLLLVVGCFMDIMSAILILAPMLAPMAAAVGVHPVHMGIVFIVNLEIGYLTPPVGLNLFVSSTLFKKPLGFVIRAVVPTLVIMLLSLVVITWAPGLSLALLEEPPPREAVDAGPADTPADAGPKRQKTIEELMREARARADGGPAPVGADAGQRRAKTIQELMAEAKASAADAGVSAPKDGGPPAP
jgi:hypothetical protein